MSATAANTDKSAVCRWGFHGPEAYAARQAQERDGLGRPDERVLAEREVAAERRAAERERRDRGQLDLGLGRAEQPAVVVHLGAARRAAKRR